MSDLQLKVLLSEDRNLSGLMQVININTNTVIAQYEALGRGSQGAGDTQMVTNGNTPTGSYSVTKIKPTANFNQSSYGPSGALELKPLDGNALAASRPGILVHGGSSGGEGYFRGEGALRATHGCIRLSNYDMGSLIQVIFESTLNEVKRISEAITITLSVDDYPCSFAKRNL